MVIAPRRLSGLPLRTGLPALLCGLSLAACASKPPSAAAGGGNDPAHPFAQPVPAVDRSYDWHVLVPAKFGTLLKDSPVPLHEVLLFRDQTPGPQTPSGETETKDCYATDAAPPRFVGREPQEHLLCFDHDRLTRIEAAVRLTADEAPQVLARACASWLKTAVAAQAGGRCEGRDGDIGFSAHLDLDAGEGAPLLSITLLAASGEATAEAAPGAPPR